jgi:hypothetical protein
MVTVMVLDSTVTGMAPCEKPAKKVTHVIPCRAGRAYHMVLDNDGYGVRW